MIALWVIEYYWEKTCGNFLLAVCSFAYVAYVVARLDLVGGLLCPEADGRMGKCAIGGKSFRVNRRSSVLSSMLLSTVYKICTSLGACWTFWKWNGVIPVRRLFDEAGILL